MSTYADQAASQQQDEEPQIHVDLEKKDQRGVIESITSCVPKQFTVGMLLGPGRGELGSLYVGRVYLDVPHVPKWKNPSPVDQEKWEGTRQGMEVIKTHTEELTMEPCPAKFPRKRPAKSQDDDTSNITFPRTTPRLPTPAL